MSSKRTQPSETNDGLNCTVLALKSVTGWKETKCQRILDEAGRERDKGFDIDAYLTKCKGRIEDVEFKRVYRKERHTHMEFTLKQLSWIVIGSLGLGGTGYMSMNSKIDELAVKVAVVHNQMDNQNKMLERIENKLNTIQGK
jgi:hypothetical protein